MAKVSRRSFVRSTAVGAGAIGLNLLPRLPANAVTTTVGTVRELVQAVNNVPPGSVIHVRGGFYDVTGYELRPTDRVSILGSGHQLGPDGYLRSVGTHIHTRGYTLLTRRSHGIRCENIWFSGTRLKYDRIRGWVAGTGCAVSGPLNATFRYCRFSDAQIAGLASFSGLVERCEIFRCGGDYSKSGSWAASAAMKSHRVTHARYNYVHDCARHGLWWDNGAEDFQCIGNKVQNVRLYGIIAEKVQRGVIRGNTVSNTGFQGLEIARSRYIDVNNNGFFGNTKGALMARDSAGKMYQGWNCTGIEVSGNRFNNQPLKIEGSIAIPGDLRLANNLGVTQLIRT